MRKQNLRLASAASNVAPIDRKAYRQLSWFKSMYSSRTDKMKVNFVQCLCVFKNFDEFFLPNFVAYTCLCFIDYSAFGSIIKYKMGCEHFIS